MSDSVEILKSHARVLHRQSQNAHPGALTRMHTMPELRKFDAALLPGHIKRRHCLAVVAKELGFSSWPQAVHALRDGTSFGDFLYPARCGGHINIWCASYEDALGVQTQQGGYLLAYSNQYLVVEESYIQTLGLDPQDPDWARIGWNWVEPIDVEARKRLLDKLISAALKH